MTSDKSRKRDIRRRMQQHNEPYAEAARRLAEQDAPPILADDVPAARVPAPVAMMLARHLDAATHHIGRAERLARGHGVSAFAEGDSLRDKPSGPLAEIADAATYDLHRLVDWAGRTAHESGAVPAVPSPWGMRPRVSARPTRSFTPSVTTGARPPAACCPVRESGPATTTAAW
ncbi:hypothetical protein ACFQX6_65935 [Streptosporangium lutulentum]